MIKHTNYHTRLQITTNHILTVSASGELVSYVALHHTSAFGSVFTHPNHQRCGLGGSSVKDISQKLIDDGQKPYVFVNPEKPDNVAFYKSCGFQYVSSAFRIRYVPCKT